jgi:hypothetical protein
MSASARSEIAKLARLLDLADPESLGYLEKVSTEELRAYREAVTDLLYDDGREVLARIADAAGLLPAGTLAKIGERALGPLICARLSGMLEPRRAAEIARHFPVEFLAALAAEMDPRRAVEVVTATPPHLVLEIALAMAAAGEHVAMGRFVAHLDDDTLASCLNRLGDEDLLRVAFVLEGERGHERLFEILGVERMRELLERGESAGLGEEVSYFREHLSSSQRKQLARAANS